MNEIENLSRMRRHILWGVLVGTGIAAVLLAYPVVVLSGRYHWWPAGRVSFPFYYGAFIVWLLTLLVFTILYMRYKAKLRRDPELRAAIDDERVRTNWLRAYRFAFYTMVAIAFIMKLAETAFAGALMRGSFSLPDQTWFILSGAILALVGSFLSYSRETDDE